MKIVSWIWFWYFLIGFTSGGCLVSLWNRLKKEAIRLVWYEWILAFIAFLFFILMVQTFIASVEEGQLRAAWMSVVFTGVPQVLITVGIYRSVRSRLKRV